MSFILISQIFYKAESLYIYIKDIGSLTGIQESYISDNKCRIDLNLSLNKEKVVSKFMEKYYGGNESLIIDLEKDSVFKVNHNEKSYYAYKIDNYMRLVEEIKENKDIKVKFSIRDLKDCYYEMKFSFENDSIVSKICYKDLNNVSLNQFFVNYNKKLQTDIDTRILEKLGIFSINNPFVKILMSGIIKKNDLEKILKIKGYPYIIDMRYYSDTTLIYIYTSKVYSIENRSLNNVFEIDSSYKSK